MGWLFLFTALVFVLYVALITFFFMGWRRIPVFELKGNEVTGIKISVIVACRDEEDHIRQLLSHVAQQSYQNFELIVVDDHSVDSTRDLILSAQEAFPTIKLIDGVGYGKKNALKEGIYCSSGNLIVTTDADCLPTNQWLETIVSYYTKYPTDLIICPVRLSVNGSLFSRLQQLEFTTLIASTAGAAGAGMPIMCNGANLVFTKSCWLDSQADLHEDELSGDDMFLLESVKKRRGVIRFLKSESAFVLTEPSETLGEFIKQRRRWTSKSPAYTDWQIILTAIAVFSINLVSLILLFLSFFSSTVLIVFLSLFMVKYLLDSIFLYSVQRFFQINNIWIYSFILSVFYPFYVVYIAFSALLFKPGTWK